MSNAPNHTGTKAKPWSERLQSWIAVLLTVLLHVLLLLMLLHEIPPTFTAPSSGSTGGRMKMEFIGKSTAPASQNKPSPPPSAAATPPSPKTPKKVAVQRRPAASRLQTTRVQHAADPVPDDTAPVPTTTAADSWSMPTRSQRVQQTQTPESPPPPSENRSADWGRPPGMLEKDTALDDGLADSSSANSGSQHNLDGNGPSLEVGGYSALYEPRAEDKVREWMAKGMKEFFIPLPGTRYYMVCTLDIVLKRGSGKCRALDPNSPQMKNIGDSREIINMLEVYKQGQLMWKGPGPYR